MGKSKYKQPLDVQLLDTIKMGSILPKLKALNLTIDKSKYEQPLDVQQLDTIKMSSIPPKLQALVSLKLLRSMDAICILLPLLAFFLWAISLQHVSVYDMNDLGLISVLSPKIIVALAILL